MSSFTPNEAQFIGSVLTALRLQERRAPWAKWVAAALAAACVVGGVAATYSLYSLVHHADRPAFFYALYWLLFCSFMGFTWSWSAFLLWKRASYRAGLLKVLEKINAVAVKNEKAT